MFGYFPLKTVNQKMSNIPRMLSVSSIYLRDSGHIIHGKPKKIYLTSNIYYSFIRESSMLSRSPVCIQKICKGKGGAVMTAAIGQVVEI